MRNYRRDIAAVGAILLSKSRLEFAVFDADHFEPCDDGERCENIDGDQACAHAPAEDLAEMAEIDRMAHTAAYARRDQLLPMLVWLELGQARDLGAIKALKGGVIDGEAGDKERRAGQPTPPVRVEVREANWPDDDKGDRDE